METNESRVERGNEAMEWLEGEMLALGLDRKALGEITGAKPPQVAVWLSGRPVPWLTVVGVREVLRLEWAKKGLGAVMATDQTNHEKDRYMAEVERLRDENTQLRLRVSELSVRVTELTVRLAAFQPPAGSVGDCAPAGPAVDGSQERRFVPGERWCVTETPVPAIPAHEVLAYTKAIAQVPDSIVASAIAGAENGLKEEGKPTGGSIDGLLKSCIDSTIATAEAVPPLKAEAQLSIPRPTTKNLGNGSKVTLIPPPQRATPMSPTASIKRVPSMAQLSGHRAPIRRAVL